MEEVAQLLRVELDDVLRDINDGHLRATAVAGTKWRVTDQALNEYLQGTPAPAPASGCDQRKPVVAGTVEMREQSVSDSEPTGSFSHQWPDSTVEDYDAGSVSEIQIGNRTLKVRIGFTNRRAAGEVRRRAVVFFGEPPRLMPVVEFIGADDFARSGKMASIIKVPNERDGRLRQLRPYEPIPTDYKKRDLVIYNHLVTGPHAAGSMAVLVTKEDTAAMIEHALIRARLKGWI